MKIPTVGTGENMTPEETKRLERIKRMQLGVSFISNILQTIPVVPDSDGYHLMTPCEVFQYAMTLVEHVDHYVETDPKGTIN